MSLFSRREFVTAELRRAASYGFICHGKFLRRGISPMLTGISATPVTCGRASAMGGGAYRLRILGKPGPRWQQFEVTQAGRKQQLTCTGHGPAAPRALWDPRAWLGQIRRELRHDLAATDLEWGSARSAQ